MPGPSGFASRRSNAPIPPAETACGGAHAQKMRSFRGSIMERYARRRLPRSFTLAELVMVLALVGLLASMAWPRFAAATTRSRADGAARRMAADLRALRGIAWRSSQSASLSIDVNGDVYTFVDIPDPDRPTATRQVRLADEPYVADLVSADFGGDTTITFDGFGNPVSDGQIVLRVGDHVRTVKLDGETGRVTIVEGLPQTVGS